MSIVDKIKDKVASFISDFARTNFQAYGNVASGVLVTNGARELDAQNFVAAGINIAISMALHWWASRDAKKLVTNTDKKVESRANDKAMDKLLDIASQTPSQAVADNANQAASELSQEQKTPASPGFPYLNKPGFRG